MAHTTLSFLSLKVLSSHFVLHMALPCKLLLIFIPICANLPACGFIGGSNHKRDKIGGKGYSLLGDGACWELGVQDKGFSGKEWIHGTYFH